MRKRREKEALHRALLWVEQKIAEKGLSGNEFSRMIGKGSSGLAVWKERLPLKIDSDTSHGLFRVLITIGVEREEILREFRRALEPHWFFGLALVDLDYGEITPAVRADAVRALWAHFQKSAASPPAPQQSQSAGSDE